MGGLGIRSTYGVAKAALLRQVWNVVINKKTCWNLWVHAKYLKEVSFWDVSIPKKASWGWKGILTLRHVALPHIKFLIGNGHLMKLWINPWLNGGLLKDCYGAQAVYNTGMSTNIRVSFFLQHDGWNFPSPTTNELMDIYWAIPNEIAPWREFDNEIVWTLEDQGQFSLKSAYKLISNISYQHLQWTSTIWL